MPADSVQKTVIGVVGGMGPLASAAFVQTIYERAVVEREQEGPVVLLVSDPTVPDRTEALLRGEKAELVAYLASSLGWLAGRGAATMVIPCVTAHHLWDDLPGELRSRTRSLVDQAFDDLAASEGRVLLFSTRGTSRLGIFTRHPRWAGLAHRLALPAQGELEAVHRLLYRLKVGAPPAEAVPQIRDLLARHGARAFLAGCTELHLVTRYLAGLGGREPGGGEVAFLDPLMTLAGELAAGGGGSAATATATGPAAS